METYLQPLISALVLALVGTVSYFLKQLVDMGIVYMKAMLSASNVQLVRDMASTIVRSLEQNPAFSDLPGSLKKERSIVALTDYAEKIGLPVDHTFVDKTIEEAVQIMKTQLGPTVQWLEGETPKISTLLSVVNSN